MKNSNLKMIQEKICGENFDTQAVANFCYGGYPYNTQPVRVQSSGIANATQLKQTPSIANFTTIRI